MSGPGTDGPGTDGPGTGGPDVGRCPTCGARVVPEQDWCSLCLQPLRAPAPSPPAIDPALTGGLAGPSDPDASDLDGPGLDGPYPDAPDLDGSDRDGPVDPADPYASAAGAAARARPAGDLPPHVAEAMLAELAAAAAAERPLAGGPLTGTTRGVRVALGFGAAVVLIGVLLVVLTLVGLLL